MCGIFFCYCCSSTHRDETGGSGPKNEPSSLKVVDELLNDPTLTHRGPDVSTQHRLPLSSEYCHGWMRGCVLHLRGQPTPQPLVDDKGNALLWNGEIFDGVEVSRDENDTQVLFNRLTMCESDEDVLKTLEQVKGPWAVIFWQAERNKLWFGRDVYGRRSLLWHLPKDLSDCVVLTSVAVGNLEYTEIPSVGIFALDLATVVTSEDCPPRQKDILPSITLHPWHNCRWPGTRHSVMETPQDELPSFLTPNQPPSIFPFSVDRRQVLKYWMPSISKTMSSPLSSVDNDAASSKRDNLSDDEIRDLVNRLDDIAKENESLRLLSEELVGVLQDAVMKRVNCLPIEDAPSRDSENPNVSEAKIAVLFSGGLDSSVIAALLDRCLPPNEPIDLLNVAFEQPRPKQNVATVKHKRHKHRKNKPLAHQGQAESNCNPIANTDNSPSPSEAPIEIETTESQKDSSASSSSLDNDVVDSQTSLSNDPKCNKNNWENPLSSASNLSTASFNSKCHIHDSSPSSSSPTLKSESENVDVDNFDPYDVPDRRTGRVAFSELNPKRQWNFVEIDISQKELQTLRSSRIGNLIYPLQTVLDDSIGCAVWFAARGRGRRMTTAMDMIQEDIASKAKVILCGMAADEQFAGYSRHRVHFHQWGEESLVNQLEQEMWRISSRNLGRDDRIIADHGKEARFPFLDETFTEFISKIPVHVRANLHLPRGLGEKLLLRLSALSLGLRQTACQPKRAIQFGSKIAKLDDGKEKGSDICNRLGLR